MFRVDPYNYSEEQQAEILSGKLKDYFASLHLKTTLTEMGIGTEHFVEMAERATRNGPVGHYVPLDAERFQEVLKLAI